VSATADPRAEWLTLFGDPGAWRAIGLTVADDGSIPLFGTSLRIVREGDPSYGGSSGIAAWSLSGVADAPPSIDGLATEMVEPQPPVFADHALGASAVDHVVVMTPDLDRTSAAIHEATGCELKRIREVGEMRQGFHRIGRGGLIVELVERPEIEQGPARFWGLVLIVDALDEACERMGTDLIRTPIDAVQPGRRIATVREDAGLGLPIALMTPDIR
jgi:hypothetical protein